MSAPPEHEYTQRRAEMVRLQLEGRDIADERVLAAMRKVPRHRFVPARHRELAYADGPVPIGHGQTISQPYVVALMTQLATGPEAHRALDVGTGCGYEAAVLAEIVDDVYSVEVIPELAESARRRLEELGYANVHLRCGNGHAGWPEAAPFDAIVVACAADEVPQALVAQLAPGGRLVIPVGVAFQELVLIEKHADGEVERTPAGAVAFVPMVEASSRSAEDRPRSPERSPRHRC